MSTRAQIEFYDVPDGPNGGEFGEPAARIYQHSDGYPEGVLPRLLYLEKILGNNSGLYGSRTDDPEWAAAEFVTQFRLPHNYVHTGERFTPVALHDGTLKGMLQRWQGGIYVTHQIHQDIEFLYRVICGAKWEVKIFQPKYDSKHDISSFEEVTDQYNMRTGKEKKVGSAEVRG